MILPNRGREQLRLPPKGKSPEISQAKEPLTGQDTLESRGESPAPKV